jgi:hypothetical protein
VNGRSRHGTVWTTTGARFIQTSARSLAQSAKGVSTRNGAEIDTRRSGRARPRGTKSAIDEDEAIFAGVNIPHYELMVEYTNEIVHDITTQWIERLIDTNRIRNQFVHESGLRMEYVFQAHGGLFQISMDRINNNYPHFYGEEYTFTNIRDAPLSMNLKYNPLDYCIKRNFVEEVVHRFQHPTPLDINTLTRSRTVFYNSAARAYNADKGLLINKFPEVGHYVKHCFELAKEQNFMCALSGIVPISGQPKKIKGIDKVFQWSLNAIDPDEESDQIQILVVVDGNGNASGVRERWKIMNQLAEWSKWKNTEWDEDGIPEEIEVYVKPPMAFSQKRKTHNLLKF